MTDLETRLEQALRADAPAPRDPMFRIEVLVRRERAAFRRRLLISAAIALGATLLAALGLGAMGRLVGPERPALVAAAAALLTAVLAGPYLVTPAALRALAGRWRMSNLWR